MGHLGEKKAYQIYKLLFARSLAIKFEMNWDWDNSVPFSQRRGVRNVTVKDCNIHHSGRHAIKLTPACSGISILNCEIHHTGVGPGAQQDFNAERIDNNFYYDSNGAVFLDDNLDWQERTLGQWKAQTFRDLHSFDTDPLLNATYHLLATSPCINAGVGLPGVTHDLDGQLRSDGTNDVGADEFSTVSAVPGPSPAQGIALKLLGNPVAEQLVFEIFSETTRETTLQIVGLDGRIWHNQVLHLAAGKMVQRVEVNALPAGAYVLRIGTHTTARFSR